MNKKRKILIIFLYFLASFGCTLLLYYGINLIIHLMNTNKALIIIIIILLAPVLLISPMSAKDDADCSDYGGGGVGCGFGLIRGLITIFVIILIATSIPAIILYWLTNPTNIKKVVQISVRITSAGRF
jgi:hypothetical protein